MSKDKIGEAKTRAMVDSGKKVLGSSRLTDFFSQEQNKTIIVTILFWDDGTVTWIGEG